MNNKLQNMGEPGVKELKCGCVCEVRTDGSTNVLQACPKTRSFFVQAGEKVPADGAGDGITDHIYDGILGLSSE